MSPLANRRTFISYSRLNKEFAMKLALELRSSGFDIWLDQLDIPTGSRWDDEVERALEECEIFMVILTPASSTSDNVKDEIGYAIDSGKRILPILLENAKVPLRLIRFNYVDFTKKSYEEGVEGAKQLLRRLIDEPTVPRDEIVETAQMLTDEESRPAWQETGEQEAEPYQESASSVAPVKKKSRTPLILGIAGVGVIAIVGLAVMAAMNGFGSTPTSGSQENNTAAEAIVPTQAPIEIIVEVTSTPAPTKTLEPTPLATDTPEPTTVPETPTPEIQKFYTEEFTGDLSSWPTFIADGKRDMKQPVITDEEFSEITMGTGGSGGYLFNIDRRQTIIYSYYNQFDYDNVRMDAQVDSRNISVNETRLMCRYSPTQGWYEFGITNNGPYKISYAKPNEHGLITYRTLADGNSTAVVRNAVNEFSIVCQGEELSLYINGELTKTTTDLFKALRTGKIGIGVASLNNLPVVVRYDWVKISEPEQSD